MGKLPSAPLGVKHGRTVKNNDGIRSECPYVEFFIPQLVSAGQV